MIRYNGGKRIGTKFYVKCGDAWIDILAAARMQEEHKRYGAYTV